MKRCPQCNSVYEDDTRYCLNDGAGLVKQTFALPSDADDFEAETVIRHDPIVVDLSAGQIPPEPIIYRNPPVETVIVEKGAKRKNPAIFLVLGLIIGGGLVLATLLLARSFYQNGNTNTNRVSETNSTESIKVSPAETPLDIDKLSQKHETRTSADDEEFNGRVIALNAYVRASPSLNSDETDVLPINDRINIERRENENSPWYFVTCEHGTSGWMHGNTIEFTQ
ncbi:hypothetical protein BH20ACI1_BH20ACI1_04470 [soil metagenome]